MSYKIAIIGTGNVAFHLTRRFHAQGISDLHILGRTLEKSHQFCQMLALKLRTLEIADLQNEMFDFAILAVPDKEIIRILDSYEFHPHTTLLHASGAVSIEVFKQKGQYGVLYPFQTFTKSREVDFTGIPILVEGSTQEVARKITSLATHLSHKIFEMTSTQRLRIHLAAVFASNFTNNLLHITERLAEGTGMHLRDFSHLVGETVQKAFELSPKSAQTGPASRHDDEVIQRHLALLDDEPLKELYVLHSQLIQKQ